MYQICIQNIPGEARRGVGKGLDDKEYITVKEFAELAGVSRQTIYNKLDKPVNGVENLTAFLKVENGIKYISKEALKLYMLDMKKQTAENILVQNTVQYLHDNVKTLQEFVKALQENNDVLTEQIAKKDEQITALNERLRESLELNRNNQVLLGSEQSRTNPALIGTQPEEKPAGWFKRLFQRNK